MNKRKTHLITRHIGYALTVNGRLRHYKQQIGIDVEIKKWKTMGKGSTPRKFSVTNEEYANRWNAIFGRDNEKKNKTQDVESDMIEATATFSGGKGDSSPPCCYPSVMTNTDDEVVNVDSRTSK